jgi:2-polyprenyl-3-methyl-5-hydroxy-6-metoxy-1,4-benzoquinol methylase
LRFLPLARPNGTALDVAAGSGRHSRLLLNHGLRVTAIDRDPDQQSNAPSLTKIKADLESGAPWPLSRQQFDLVVVTNYLHRPILDAIIGAVAPSGLLLYETFAAGNERFGKPSNPDFLLRPGELKTAVAGRLEIIAYEEVELDAPRPAVVQRIAARDSDDGGRRP